MSRWKQTSYFDVRFVFLYDNYGKRRTDID